MNKVTSDTSAIHIRNFADKVTWPNWDQLQQSTMIVLGATIVITAIVAVMDFGVNGSLKFITPYLNNHGRRDHNTGKY